MGAMNGFALRNYFWLPPLPAWINGAAFAFAFRNWFAAMLALYIAFALQLESPVWAWLTAWIVAQPTPGMVLSRGFYRFAGTVAGAIFAVILMANFAQTPELFVLALALLVGGCTVLANILTNNRAYAAVLAGYTAAIVASDAIASPSDVFTIALARGAAISVGVACGILANSIFAPHRAEPETRRRLADLLNLAARRAAIPWQTPLADKIKVGKKLIDDAIALNTLIEYAAAESGIFRLQANNARSLLAHVFGLISARRSLDAHLHHHGWPAHDALQIYHGIVLDLLNDMPAKLDAGQLNEELAEIAAIRRQLAGLRPENDSPNAADVISARLVIDRIDDLLEHLGGALEDWRDILEERWHPEPRRVLNFHRDLRAAWINGLRAFIAVCLTGAFWIASAWPDGPSALIFVSVMLSLFSYFPRPDRVGWAFSWASLPGAPAGIFCKFVLLSAATGYEYLLLVSLLMLIPLGLVMSNVALARCLRRLRLVRDRREGIWIRDEAVGIGRAHLRLIDRIHGGLLLGIGQLQQRHDIVHLRRRGGFRARGLLIGLQLLVIGLLLVGQDGRQRLVERVGGRRSGRVDLAAVWNRCRISSRRACCRHPWPP